MFTNTEKQTFTNLLDKQISFYRTQLTNLRELIKNEAVNTVTVNSLVNTSDLIMDRIEVLTAIKVELASDTCQYISTGRF